MPAVYSAWGKSHETLVWEKCQSTCLTFCGLETCSLPLDSPKGTSCQQLLFFSPCISRILHRAVPSRHILEKQMTYYYVFWGFFLLCSQVFHQISRLPWQQIGMSRWHFTLVLPHVNVDFTAIPIPDFTENAVRGGKWRRRGVRTSVCVCVCVWVAGWLTLGECPWAGFRERERHGFRKQDPAKQVTSLPTPHGECHSCSQLKPTWPLCEGEALPSDTLWIEH